jgi:hypothetical protein
MNAEFISRGLNEFFVNSKLAINADSTAEQAATYLSDLKKDKASGQEVWTITMRNIGEKRVKAKRKRAKIEQGTVSPEDETDTDTVSEDMVAPPSSKRQRVML